MPRYHDVFNGDADGICALHQLRLAEPREARLVTGVKRDVRLLARITGEAEEITVLDVSLAANRDDLLRLLATSRVVYIDHHYPGDIPVSERLVTHIDPAPEVCTSLIVDRLLQGRFRAWAVVAAFGDNLHAPARRAAASLGLSEEQTARLRELGELMNYNGYGRTVADLHFPPDELYRAVAPYEDPFAFLSHAQAPARLRQGFADDMRRARAVSPEDIKGIGRLYRLPNAPWARRAVGVLANEKARERPDLAHALFVDNGDGTWLVSVRAPLERRRGADELCRAFPTGGGRQAAAGVNALPNDMLDAFRHAFAKTFAP